jgi:hypothetical protein
MQRRRQILSLALAALVILAVAPLNAQEPLYPIGKVWIESTSIAAGVGVSWGDGKLTFKGKDYRFKVDGLSVGAVGISKISAVGDVYSLNSPSDLAGTYAAVGGGIALAGGVAGLTMKNQKGVLINLRSVQQGVELNLGPKGFSISMK